VSQCTNAPDGEKSLAMKRGTAVDAYLIAASSSSKNTDKKRGPNMGKPLSDTTMLFLSIGYNHR
jgi:hypothetical protein